MENLSHLLPIFRKKREGNKTLKSAINYPKAMDDFSSIMSGARALNISLSINILNNDCERQF